MSRPLRRGSLFGIDVETRLELPFLARVAGGSAEVARSHLRVPDADPLHDSGKLRVYGETDSSFILETPASIVGISREQTRIDGERPAGAEFGVLLAWPVLLSLLGRESFHGCVIERDGRALAMLGNPGSGKSTIALPAHERGLRVLSDDIVALDDEQRALPGPAFIRLRHHHPGTAGETNAGGKYWLHLPACGTPARLAGILVLDASCGALATVSGSRAADLLLHHLANGHLLFPQQRVNRFRFATSLAAQLPILGAKPRSLPPEDVCAFV